MPLACEVAGCPTPDAWSFVALVKNGRGGVARLCATHEAAEATRSAKQ